jgi:mannose-6-phosphate isomerase-like protein (cupin superfamily)
VSNEELKKSYPNLNELTMATVAATPAYRVSTVARPYYEPARMTPISKMSSHWDDGEMHEDMTQIYVILEGTGVIIVGGKAVHEASSRPGEHGGGPIEGGTSYKVKPGDWVVIPPLTWHQAQPDRGGLSYAMVHMSTRTNVP